MRRDVISAPVLAERHFTYSGGAAGSSIAEGHKRGEERERWDGTRKCQRKEERGVIMPLFLISLNYLSVPIS